MADTIDPTTRERWLGVELRHLAALEAISREGSFRAAADSLGYVQSAISQQLFHLESLVGTRLIDRTRGSSPLAVTDAGRLLLQHVEVILERFGAAQQELTALLDGRSGSLRIGSFQDVSTRLLPQVLPGFARTSPDISVVPVECRSDAALFELVEQGEVDLAFCQLPLLAGPFSHVELIDDPYVLLVPSESPLADRDDAPTLCDIEQMPLIGYNDDRAQSQMLESFSSQGLAPEFTLRSDLNATVQAFVARNLGVAVAPYLSVDPRNPSTTVLELSELPPRKIALIWHAERDRSTAAERFTEAVVTACMRWFRHGHSSVPRG